MRLLFLTDEFYPQFGANSLLVRTLAEELIRNGHEVFVMPFSYDKTLPRVENYNGIQVVRCISPDGKQEVLTALKRGQAATALTMMVKYARQRFSCRERLFHKEWIAPRGVLRDFVRERHVDAVISICCSIELSFPLLYLRKKNQLPCRWIFYMIDPFESHGYYRSLEKIPTLRKIQHDIMKHCDGVAATELIRKDTAEWETADILKKITVLHFPKIIPLHHRPQPNDVLMDRSKINVLCTGTRDDEVRNSAYTLSLCRRIKDVRFHFIGVDWTAGDEIEYSDNLIFYPRRSWQEVVNMQFQCDFLLNIGNARPNQLPSKVLEYISTGKPIINVCKTEQCPTIPLLAQHDCLTVMEQDDIETSARRLDDYIRQPHTTVPFDEIREKYLSYTPPAVLERLMEMIRKPNA